MSPCARTGSEAKTPIFAANGNFGNFRDGWGVSECMLGQDARWAWRMWKRHPSFAITAIGTLALGLGAATALFSICDRVLFRSLPYADADQLVSIGITAPLDTSEFLFAGDYKTLWTETPQPFESVTTVVAGTSTCDLTEDRPERLTCAQVQANLLATLGLKVVAGRDLRGEDDKPGAAKVALISHELWARRFNSSRAVIGRLLSVDAQGVQIVGVLPAEFEMPTLAKADILVPQQRPGAMQFLRGFARLKAGVTIEQANDGLQPLFQAMLKNVPPQFRAEVKLRVRSLRDRQLGDSRQAAWFLLGAVSALLLIACTNVANLILARSAARQRELAIRTALGAGRGRLARLAFTESSLLAITGGVSGVAMAWVLLKVLLAFAPEGVPMFQQVSLDVRAVVAALVLSAGAALFNGLWPSLSAPRAESIQASRTAGSIRPWARFSFVAIQIGLTFALIGSSMLLLRSLWNMQNLALGFDADRVLSASITLNNARYPKPDQQVAFFERVLQDASNTPGTVAAALSDSLPPSGQMRSMVYAAIEVEGRPLPRQGTGGMIPWRSVTPGYFEALRIPIVRGRGFTKEDRASAARVMIVSESLARKLFPNEDALGKRLRPGLGDQVWHTVVGIARDVRNGGITTPADPEFYMLRRTSERDAMRRSFLVFRTQMPSASAAAYIRERIGVIDRELPVTIATMNERVSQLSARPRFTAFLLVAFGALAMLLAAVGLAGVAGYLVTERTRDIGVRMAVGATPANVRSEVLSEAARWVLAGTALGAFMSAGTARLISSFLFGVIPADPWAWSATMFVLAIVSGLAVLRPANRAARIDPMVALRSE